MLEQDDSESDQMQASVMPFAGLSDRKEEIDPKSKRAIELTDVEIVMLQR